MPKNPTQWDAVRLSIFCCRRNIPSFISTTHLAEALGQCGRGAWEKMQRHSELSLLKRPPQYPQSNILWRSVFSKEFLLASYIYCQYLWMGLLFCIWKAQAGSWATARSVLPVVLWRWKVCTSRWEIRPALMSLGKNVVPWRAKRGGLGWLHYLPRETIPTVCLDPKGDFSAQHVGPMDLPTRSGPFCE